MSLSKGAHVTVKERMQNYRFDLCEENEIKVLNVCVCVLHHEKQMFTKQIPVRRQFHVHHFLYKFGATEGSSLIVSTHSVLCY